MHSNDTEITTEELHGELVAELPGRDLLAGISILGLPLVGIDGVTVNVDTSGPGWLISA